jgi:predicted kinase
MDQFAGHVIILSGSPGSGKTTTAEMLARLPGCPKVHLHTDDFWGYIKHGHIEPWLPEAARQNQMIMDIAAGVAQRYAQNGYLVALDGVIGPWSLAPYQSLDVPVHYLLLRAPVAEAIARCQARGGDSLTDPVVVADVHAMFADMGQYESHVLPVGHLDRQATLALVVDELSSGKYRLV